MIRLENVHLALRGKPVLRGITLEIVPGDRVVIMGQSGIGKSTVLRVILGLWKPDRGRVFLDGEDIHQMTAEDLIEKRKKLAVVFQGGALFDSLTVGENVGYRLFEEGRLSPTEIEGVVHEKLASVGLDEAIDLYPAQLSGGMRKRVAFARALAADPRCILFDEPTAGLDPVAACKINQLILQCQRRGKETVVVTHDLDCAYRVGQRLMLISEGQIVFDGDRKAMDACQEPALRRFLKPEACS